MNRSQEPKGLEARAKQILKDKESSKKAKAIKHYTKFLELLKDTNSGIAEVGDALERLVGLRGDDKYNSE